MTSRKLVSVEVAERLGITRTNLITYLNRHPELRPIERLPNGDLLWSDEEIARLVAVRANRGKPAE